MSATRKSGRKIRVGIVFGGRSSEHEVSLLSARSVIGAIDRSVYDIRLIGIGKDGRWLATKGEACLRNADDPKEISIDRSVTGELAIRPGHGGIGPIDVIFPVLHGTYGEDGSIQGLLRMLDLPFVGPDILGSALGMDKDVTKRLLRDAGIPIADFLCVHHRNDVRFAEARKKLGMPVFIKPANQGSSVGVSKASDSASFRRGLKKAFSYDTKVLIERAVPGREIEVAVLGNERPAASVPGEVIPHHEFYSYEAKYLDARGAGLEIPARLSRSQSDRARALALRAFRVLELEGMARVDFFMKKDGTFVVNEVNTIPGFTAVSMYPKLWEASGLAYPKLIDRLIRLARERHARRKRLRTATD